MNRFLRGVLSDAETMRAHRFVLVNSPIPAVRAWSYRDVLAKVSK